MALSNLRLVAPNAADLLSFGTPSPVLSAATSVANLQSSLRARVIRTTSRATQIITGNWSTAPIIGAVALVRHNLTTHCRWKVELFPLINQGGTVLYDSGTVEVISSGAVGWDLNTAILWLTSAVQPLSMRITISTTNPSYPEAGYFEVGRLIMGPVWSPGINATHDGWISAWREDSRQARTGSGSIRSETGPSFRTITLPLEWLTESERASLWEILRQVGLRKDILISGMPGADAVPERDHLMVGRAIQMPDFGHPINGYFGTRLELEET